MAQIAPYIFPQFFDDNGDPLNGGLIYAYAAGTTTPQNTYSNAAGTSANTNPIVLSSSGRTKVFLQNLAYDFVIKNSAGETIDSISGVGSAAISGGASFIDTISELRALASGAFNYVEVGGYSTKGDGGGGLFYWDATETAADLGVNIQPNSLPAAGRWVREYSGKINVKWFGAKGDGVTDDSASVSAAATFVQGLALGGVLLFPPSAGKYATGSNLTFGAETVVRMENGAEFSGLGGTRIITFGADLEGGKGKHFDSTVLAVFTKRRSFHPVWWGAVADGVTDDSAAYNAASACALASGKGKIFVSGHSYLASTVNLGTGVSVVGFGEYGASKLSGPNTIIGLQFNGTSYHQHSLVQDLELSGFNIGIDSSPDVLNGSTYVDIERVRFHQCATAGYRCHGGYDNSAGEAWNGYNNLIDCTFACDAVGATAVELYGNITTFTMRDCKLFSGVRGVWIRGGRIDTLNFFNCAFDGFTTACIDMDESVYLVWDAASPSVGTRVRNNARNIINIDYCRFESSAIAVRGTQYYYGGSVRNCFAACTVTGGGTFEIDGEDWDIHGNFIWNAAAVTSTSYGIWLKSNSKRCKIGPNIWPMWNPRPGVDVQDDGSNFVSLELYRDKPAAGNVFAKQFFTTVGFAGSALSYCTSGGTHGTLVGVTATAVAGNSTAVLSSVADITPKTKISINGTGDEYTVTEVTESTNTVRLDTVISAGSAGVGVAVAYIAPTYREIPMKEATDTLKLTALSASKAVFTDADQKLTSTPPTLSEFNSIQIDNQLKSNGAIRMGIDEDNSGTGLYYEWWNNGIGTGTLMAKLWDDGTGFQLLAGAGSAYARVGGVVNVNTTAVGNVGAGEDDLMTYAVLANTLARNGDSLSMTAAGTFAASVNNKRLRVYFGNSLLFDSGALAITAASDWFVDVEVIRVDATNQKARVTLRCTDTAVTVVGDYTAPDRILTSGHTLKITGAGTADNDIVQQMMKVRWEPAT